MLLNQQNEEKEDAPVEYNDYEEMIREMTSIADADRLSRLLEEDARRYDKSFCDDREAGRI